jgi:hypothetical protein
MMIKLRFIAGMATNMLRIATAGALIAGCTPAQLVVNVDPELERAADVFEVRRPDAFLQEDSLNVTFGPYRVAAMDIDWTHTSSHGKESEYRWAAGAITLPDSPLDWLEVDNLLRPYLALEQVSHREEAVTKELRYVFKSEGDGPWTARCKYAATQDRMDVNRVIGLGKRKGDASYTQSQTTGFRFACVYKQPDAEPWTLTISAGGQELQDHRLVRPDAAGNAVVFPFIKPDIRLTQGDTTYTADLSMTANVVATDGSDRRSHLVVSGYYWMAGERKIAALANLSQRTPRLWLARFNDAATNHALAMASTGVMLFRWVISDA